MNRDEINSVLLYTHAAFVVMIGILGVFTLLLNESIKRAKDDIKVHIEETIDNLEINANQIQKAPLENISQPRHD